MCIRDRAYLELVELDGRVAVAQDSRDAFDATHTLFNKRYGAGIVSRLQVTRAEAALAAAEGTLNDIERQVSEKENQICVLIGRNPGTVQRTAPGKEMNPPPTVPAGIPSQLLERRPDIRQAEQNLRSASARIGVANANFFPQMCIRDRAWLTPQIRKWIAVAVALLAVLVAVAVFLYRGKG